MEDHVRKLIEKEKEELDKLNEERLLKEKSLKEEIQLQDIRRSIEELEKEEVTLKTKLEKVQKENFSLRISINAWQTVRTKKLDEFKQAERSLNELYKEIWNGREEFCSKADHFNNEFGILSDWWKTQMEYVNDLENHGKARIEDEKQGEDIEKLQKEMVESKREEKTEEAQPPKESERESETSTSLVMKDKTDFTTKNIKFFEEEDKMEVCSEEIVIPNNELYSLMDINKVKMANRNKKAFRSRIRKLFNDK